MGWPAPVWHERSALTGRPAWRYRGFWIEPSRLLGGGLRWSFQHDAYDGAPESWEVDSRDMRFGWAETHSGAVEAIDALCEDEGLDAEGNYPPRCAS